MSLFSSSTELRACSVQSTPTMAVPSFGGKCESLSDFAQEVELCRRVAKLGVTERASGLVLQMVLQKGPGAAGSDQFLEQDAASKIMLLPHDYSAPDASD